MKNIIPSFRDSLFSKNTDILIDISEYTIDNLIKSSDTLTDFPIIKTIASVLKGAYNIYDRNLLKNTLVFIQELNSGTIDEEKYIAYKATLEHNPNKCEKELGRVILILNNIIDVSKSKMLARLFKAYINKVLTWEEFCEYSEIVNRIFLEDIELLIKINEGEVTFINEDDKEKYRIHRLNSIGVIDIGIDWITVAILNGSNKLKQLVTINDVGKKFLEIVLDFDYQNIIRLKDN